MSEPKRKPKLVEVYTDEQYEAARAAGDVIADRRMDSKYERSGESEQVDVAGISGDDDSDNDEEADEEYDDEM